MMHELNHANAFRNWCEAAEGMKSEDFKTLPDCENGKKALAKYLREGWDRVMAEERKRDGQ